MIIQEDYFKNIFNAVREAILILNENMKVLSANRSFFETFKVDSSNTIGSLLYDFVNENTRIAQPQGTEIRKIKFDYKDDIDRQTTFNRNISELLIL